MNFGFTEEEYTRVRDWLMSAIIIGNGSFEEAEMLEKLRSNEWHLITTENSAVVIQLCEIDGEKIANVLVVGGKIGGSLRELMRVLLVFCEYLRTQNFTKLVGQPRKEWHRLLLNYGFEQEQKEWIKRLN